MVEICLSSMHPTTLLPARSHGNPDRFYEVANSALLPLTYSSVKLLFDGFVPRTNDQNEYESDAHFP